MLKDFATPEATRDLFDSQPDLGYGLLGRSGLSASAAGFGGYRISQGVRHHAKALNKALLAGINLIDTSANYADGGSERLVGQVLTDLVESGKLNRRQVIVVSKVGYLQGQNFALSQQRKQEGKPFPELVEYGKGLEHCIHPEFLEDQLTRSLERLNLETLDFYLLHNPEYYLDWCAKNGVALETARTEFYRRIRAALEFLEQAVSQGRIRAYGISSNTFVSSADDPEFACLETIYETAEQISSSHNLGLIQLPFNLFEPGAVLEPNQPGGQSVLGFARQKNLGVLANRPLNAFTGNRLIRLADIEAPERQDSDQIIGKIRAVQKSEIRFWRRLLPGLDIRDGLKTRIKQQVSISDSLKHYYLNFGSYENFRQYRDSHFLPHVNGVIDFLKQHVSDDEDVTQWIDSHMTALSEAFAAVGSIYAEETDMQIRRIRRLVNETDHDWAIPETMSGKAIRAVRSTAGVSTVLVGMRRVAYVDDVVAELRQPVRQADKTESWEKLQRGLSEMRFW